MVLNRAGFDVALQNGGVAPFAADQTCADMERRVYVTVSIMAMNGSMVAESKERGALGVTLLGVNMREFETEEEDLRRPIRPEQHHNDRAGRTEG